MNDDIRAFIEFKNRYLVESGTYMGKSIEIALKNGFSNIISYEISPLLCSKAIQKFITYPNVKIFFKSSVDMCDEILEINEPITFWLDAHYSSGYSTYDPLNYYPLLKELECISKHPIKNHTICIDDRRLMKKTDIDTPDNIGVTEEEVREALLQINPNYKIEYRDNHIKDDVIVAYIE
jgi:hypothetical protein